MTYLPGIHISDRILFRRCRRKWDFASPLRRGLETATERPSAALWFGTLWHYMLENLHGYRVFTPEEAIARYCTAFSPEESPEEAEELRELALEMAEYYTQFWLPQHNEFKTFWRDDQPQVEVDFSIKAPGVKVPFSGTFDRIVQDTYGRLWVCEYKTAARIDTSKLDTDPQVNAYLWAAERFYRLPFEGVAYYQFIKSPPKPPRKLSNGDFSQAANQRTTYAMYRKALREQFGTIPERYKDFLEALKDEETPEGDKFIRLDKIYRNGFHAKSEQWKLQMEAREMLSTRTKLYPNPTRDCAWDCQFKAVCLAMDDGSDWEDMLREGYRPRNLISWRDTINDES